MVEGVQQGPVLVACSTFAEELLSPSSVQPALHLRLRQLEAMRR